MTSLAKQINQTINTIVLKSENHLELLVGQCQSQISLTNTQEHILMLLREEKVNNSDLAKALNISQAAVTKAIKSLKSKKLLETVKDKKDARMTYYQLTVEAEAIAQEHARHHELTLDTYQDLTDQFSASEQAVISRFLAELLDKIGDEK